jgi:hypothetical protein
MYTSSGRDIEMSVASTKAFYSQIVAGAIVGALHCLLKKRRDAPLSAVKSSNCWRCLPRCAKFLP